MKNSDSFQFVRFLWSRIAERLWVKPLAMCVLSVLGVFLATFLDGVELADSLPTITSEAVEALLTIMTASMLVISTFAIGAMVSAYASASKVATPRSFSLVIQDNISQNALSVFVGAFIFSSVALVALKNNYLGSAGRFAVFVMSVIAFAAVIFLFVGWMDHIARVGRLGETIDKVEKATAAALVLRRNAPTLNGVSRGQKQPTGRPVFSDTVGYVECINVAGLQKWAQKTQTRITIECLPGKFVPPQQPLAYVDTQPDEQADLDLKQVARKFTVGNQRTFEDDPRFGLIVMSQIASRALSPGVNDPGTAIDVIGALVRILVLWNSPQTNGDIPKPKYDRVEVPQIEARELFNDAFTAIARDGAAIVEVSLCLQKALSSLAASGNDEMRTAAMHHSRQALARAEIAMKLPQDLEAVRAAADLN